MPVTVSRQRGSRQGQALVEFALVLPFLLILVLLIIQYGIIFYTAIGVTNVSREGARFAAVSPTSDSAIKARMQATLPPNIKWSDVAVTITPSEGSEDRVMGSNKLIKVAVSYNMNKKLFLPSTFLGVTIFNGTYKTDATMMVE